MTLRNPLIDELLKAEDLAELQRIQGADHYAVLLIERDRAQVWTR